MFCNKCGTNCPDTTEFCPNCGNRLNSAPQQAAYAQPYAQQPRTIVDPTQAAANKSVLVFGILGLAFTCSFYLSILGIIFSIIALNKAKNYAMNYGLSGKAKVGRGLALGGLIGGIVLTVILIIVVICAIAYASQINSAYHSLYNYLY